MTQPPVQRALLLLAAACPEASAEALAQLSIGRRDARLLTLREWTFGSQLLSLAACPKCSERLELSFNVADIRVERESEPAVQVALSIEDSEMRFRLPNSLDLACIAGSNNLAAARQLLLARCLVEAHHNGEQAAIDQLPVEVVETAVKRLAEADPQAEVQLNLSCPACGHQWLALFDIVSFFWSEINAWAYRILHEVHFLASAYGWREADILALSPSRRQFYLDRLK
ncbi:MAG: phage baseplate protein [bacterium]